MDGAVIVVVVDDNKTRDTQAMIVFVWMKEDDDNQKIKEYGYGGYGTKSTQNDRRYAK